MINKLSEALVRGLLSLIVIAILAIGFLISPIIGGIFFIIFLLCIAGG